MLEHIHWMGVGMELCVGTYTLDGCWHGVVCRNIYTGWVLAWSCVLEHIHWMGVGMELCRNIYTGWVLVWSYVVRMEMCIHTGLMLA